MCILCKKYNIIRLLYIEKVLLDCYDKGLVMVVNILHLMKGGKLAA